MSIEIESAEYVTCRNKEIVSPNPKIFLTYFYLLFAVLFA